MDQVVQGLPNVYCFLDDILVTGNNDAHHLENLKAVLNRLEQFGLRAQKEKCEFFRSSLEYLGHVIDSKGLHKLPDKVCAILDAPEPPHRLSCALSWDSLTTMHALFHTCQPFSTC